VGGLFQAIEGLSKQYDLVFKGVPAVAFQEVYNSFAIKAEFIQALWNFNIDL